MEPQMSTQDKFKAANEARQMAMLEAMSALHDLRDCLSERGASDLTLKLLDRFSEKAQKLRKSVAHEYLHANLLKDALRKETA
jgi:hypothetical protein